MKKNSNKLRYLITVLSIIVIILVFQSFYFSSKETSVYIEGERKYVGVILGYGKVKSLDEQLSVANSIGYITEMYVTEGDKVKTTDLLFKITPEQYEKKLALHQSQKRLLELALKNEKLDNKLKVLEIDSNITNLKIEKKLLKQFIDKNSSLAEKGIISSIEYERMIKDFSLLENKVVQESQKKEIIVEIFNEKTHASEEKIEIFDKQYEIEFHGNNETKSTINGIVQDIYIQKGQYVNIGDKILNVVGENNLKVVLEVPQHKASKIKINDKAEIIISNSTIKAFIYNISTKVNSGVVTITLEADTKNDLNKFINHSVSGRIFSKESKNILAVKYFDLFQENLSKNHNVLDVNNKIVNRNIQFGHRYDNYIEIISGLFDGEKIIINENEVL